MGGSGVRLTEVKTRAPQAHLSMSTGTPSVQKCGEDLEIAQEASVDLWS